MDVMIEFSTSFLDAIAHFLGSEPIIYLFAICCLVGITKVVRQLLP